MILANWTKPLVNSPAGWLVMKRLARNHVPQLEREVTALGRFQHAHVPLTDRKERPADTRPPE